MLAAASTLAILAVFAAGCRGGQRAEPTPVGTEALRPVALPELLTLEAPVQKQIRERQAALLRLQGSPGGGSAELGQAYGEMGKLLMAAEYNELAEPYLLNAQTLAPQQPQWHYYLGHVYKTRGMLPEAITAFEQALVLEPDDLPTLIWLGEVQLEAGLPAVAEQYFARALTQQPQSVAVRFGMGRAALAQRNYPEAIEHLEAALALNRQAVNIHYPLAMAYRGRGDTARAEAHLKQQGKFEILPADPRMEEVRGLLESAASYEVRGTRELTSGRWAEAVAAFRQGLEIDPSNAALRHKLGTALHMLGQPDAARQAFEQVVRESPEYSKAHYSLGVLLESSGRIQDAIARYAAAVRYEPGYTEARVRLAGLLRLQGRARESLAHYEEALAVDPRVPEALFGSAMAFVRLQRYQEARDRLRTALQVHPAQPGFTHALARVLAAAPDPQVRDGRQAMALMQALPEEQRRLDLGETMAMVLAEVGQYEEAATWQRGAIDAARRKGNEPLAQRMAANLRLYEARRSCRTPWRNEDQP
jgi:tetratricopeptide (TPR) repeat protein